MEKSAEANTAKPFPLRPGSGPGKGLSDLQNLTEILLFSQPAHLVGQKTFVSGFNQCEIHNMTKADTHRCIRGLKKIQNN